MTANGDVIRAKSNVFDGYSVSGSATTFTGKASYQLNGTAVGNFQFVGYGQDNGSLGAGADKFGLYFASDPNGLGTATSAGSLAASARIIGGGNIQVPKK